TPKCGAQSVSASVFAKMTVATLLLGAQAARNPLGGNLYLRRLSRTKRLLTNRGTPATRAAYKNPWIGSGRILSLRFDVCAPPRASHSRRCSRSPSALEPI